MDINKVHTIYFLGIGGIGMSALARYFHRTGKEIYGYDLTPSALTTQLEAEGIKIHFDEKLDTLPKKIDLMIYTPAVPKIHPAYKFFRQKGIPVLKRAEVIGLLTLNYFTIAVAGTHGKTSISAIASHILKSAEKNITAFVGGIMNNYSSNLILTDPTKMLLVEADEFDRSFLQIKANISIISSMDDDHLDVYGEHEELQINFRKFAENLSEDGTLLLNDKLPIFEGLNRKTLHYGTKVSSDFRAENIRIIDGCYTFDLVTPKFFIDGIKMTVPGLHYIENAAAASSVAVLLGLTEEEIKRGLESFKGVERRFQFRVKNTDCVFIDDYAHHPEEINATIKTVQSLFPEKKITGIFQPHLYSRTKDFAAEFAHALDKLDEIILLDIYPAREEPIEGVSSEIIIKKMKNDSTCILSKKEVFQQLKKKKPEVLLTMGAGDIGLMADKIELLLKK